MQQLNRILTPGLAYELVQVEVNRGMIPTFWDADAPWVECLSTHHLWEQVRMKAGLLRVTVLKGKRRKRNSFFLYVFRMGWPPGIPHGDTSSVELWGHPAAISDTRGVAIETRLVLKATFSTKHGSKNTIQVESASS